MDFLKLFIAALMPVLKVILVTMVETFLALDRFDILREHARKHLNTMAFFVFGPARVYSSLSKSLTFESLAMLWYNIVRVSSKKTSNGNKAEASNENSLPAPETDAEANSKCSTEQLDTAESKSQTNDDVHHLEMESTVPNGKAKIARVTKQLQLLAKKLNLQKVLVSPSTIGAIIGIIIGGVSPFRKALIGDSAPLRVVQDSASLVGGAYIPTVTLLIGASLLQGLKGKSLRIPLIIGIIAVKFIALPVLGVAIVKGAVRFGLIHRDPLYQFVLLLQFALPPAVTISTMTQMFGAGQTECSVIMFATYACATVSLTLWSAFFMWLLQ